MAFIIDGSTGIATVDGSVSAPSQRGQDSNSGISYAADTIKFSTNGVERFAISNSGLSGDGSGLSGIATTAIAFYARQGTEQSIAHNTYTKIANLDQDEITQNAGSSWADSRFTVASGQEGVYFLFGGAGIDDIQRTDNVNIRFYKSGTYLDPYNFEKAQYSGGSTPNVIVGAGTLAFPVNLAVGDYVELYVYHNEGSSEATEAALTWFGGFKI